MSLALGRLYPKEGSRPHVPHRCESMWINGMQSRSAHLCLNSASAPPNRLALCTYISLQYHYLTRAVLGFAKTSVQTAGCCSIGVVECGPEPELLRAGPLIHILPVLEVKTHRSLDRNQQPTASSQQPSQQYSASQTIHSLSSTPLHSQGQSQTASQATVRASSFRGERYFCRCMTSSLRRTVWTKVSDLPTSFRQGESGHEPQANCAPSSSVVLDRLLASARVGILARRRPRLRHRSGLPRR